MACLAVSRVVSPVVSRGAGRAVAPAVNPEARHAVHVAPPAAPGWGRIGGFAVLQLAQAGCQLPAQRHQRVLVVVAEAQVLLALDEQHAHQLAAGQQRHGQLAVRLGQAGPGDLARGTGIARLVRRQVLAHRLHIGLLAGQVADAHGHALARGHADHALAQADLRAHARAAVAAAGHGVEALCGSVVHQHQRVLDVQLAGQAVQQRLQQAIEVTAAVQCLGAATQRGQPVDPGRGRRQVGLAHTVDVGHFVNIGAEQMEHTGHAAVRGDARELGLHALEQRAFGLRGQVAGAEAVERAGPGDGRPGSPRAGRPARCAVSC